MDTPSYLSGAEFKAILKKIRLDYADRTEPFDFTELKAYFNGAALTVSQADMLWKFLDSYMILVAHIDENDPLFACVPETPAEDEEAAPAAAPAATVASNDEAPNKKSLFSSLFAFLKK